MTGVEKGVISAVLKEQIDSKKDGAGTDISVSLIHAYDKDFKKYISTIKTFKEKEKEKNAMGQCNQNFLCRYSSSDPYCLSFTKVSDKGSKHYRFEAYYPKGYLSVADCPTGEIQWMQQDKLDIKGLDDDFLAKYSRSTFDYEFDDDDAQKVSKVPRDPKVPGLSAETVRSTVKVMCRQNEAEDSNTALSEKIAQSFQKLHSNDSLVKLLEVAYPEIQSSPGAIAFLMGTSDTMALAEEDKDNLNIYATGSGFNYGVFDTDPYEETCLIINMQNAQTTRTEISISETKLQAKGVAGNTSAFIANKRKAQVTIVDVNALSTGHNTVKINDGEIEDPNFLKVYLVGHCKKGANEISGQRMDEKGEMVEHKMTASEYAGMIFEQARPQNNSDSFPAKIRVSCIACFAGASSKEGEGDSFAMALWRELNDLKKTNKVNCDFEICARTTAVPRTTEENNFEMQNANKSSNLVIIADNPKEPGNPMRHAVNIEDSSELNELLKTDDASSLPQQDDQTDSVATALPQENAITAAEAAQQTNKSTDGAGRKPYLLSQLRANNFPDVVPGGGKKAHVTINKEPCLGNYYCFPNDPKNAQSFIDSLNQTGNVARLSGDKTHGESCTVKVSDAGLKKVKLLCSSAEPQTQTIVDPSVKTTKPGR